MKYFAFLALILACGAGHASSTCYQLARIQTPEGAITTGVRYETWCYETLNYPNGSTFIYNADNKEVRPEMAMLISPDGLITHGSLVAGEVSIHEVMIKNFNPFSVPLVEPRSLPPVPDSEIQVSEESAKKVLSIFLRPSRASVETINLQAGQYSAAVPADHLPWRGFWWPYRGAGLYGNSQSPLAKYDRFVAAKSGVNPNSRGWESSHHYYKGVSWEGHCNGWAASAILRAEPTAKRDAATGISFSVSDVKGILSERDYCASTAFFGHRYNSRYGEDIHDIYPAEFHQALVYYIGVLGKPVAVDVQSNSVVENNIISKYQMTISKTGTNTYTVTNTLTIHKYDNFRTNTPGVAPTYTRTYRYVLVDDGNGNIIRSRWLSGNPDFLWVPLGSPNCNSQNPRISEDWTRQILNLPAQ